jgi:hypothetical protein
MEHSVKNIINLKKLNILNISNFVWAVLLAYTLLHIFVNNVFTVKSINSKLVSNTGLPVYTQRVIDGTDCFTSKLFFHVTYKNIYIIL